MAFSVSAPGHAASAVAVAARDASPVATCLAIQGVGTRITLRLAPN